jgi:hypothetical protein
MGKRGLERLCLSCKEVRACPLGEGLQRKYFTDLSTRLEGLSTRDPPSRLTLVGPRKPRDESDHSGKRKRSGDLMPTTQLVWIYQAVSCSRRSLSQYIHKLNALLDNHIEETRTPCKFADSGGHYAHTLYFVPKVQLQITTQASIRRTHGRGRVKFEIRQLNHNPDVDS